MFIATTVNVRHVDTEWYQFGVGFVCPNGIKHIKTGLENEAVENGVKQNAEFEDDTKRVEIGIFSLKLGGARC